MKVAKVLAVEISNGRTMPATRGLVFRDIGSVKI